MIYPIKTWKGYGYKFWQRTWYGVHHRGVDFICDIKTPVYASFNGLTYPKVGFQGGKQIWMYSDDKKVRARYMHLLAMSVISGGRVKQGDLIGYTGNTGALTTGPHLHYDIMINGQWVDPLKVLNKEEEDFLTKIGMKSYAELIEKLESDGFMKKDPRFNIDQNDGSVWIVNNNKKYKYGDAHDDDAILAGKFCKENLSEAEKKYRRAYNRKSVL